MHLVVYSTKPSEGHLTKKGIDAIGLDVVTKRKLRECIKEMNQDKKTTIILTTHDMNDIEAVCNRLILIDKGKKLFDGSMNMFRETYATGLEFVLEFADACPEWNDRDSSKPMQ